MGLIFGLDSVMVSTNFILCKTVLTITLSNLNPTPMFQINPYLPLQYNMVAIDGNWGLRQDTGCNVGLTFGLESVRQFHGKRK